MLINSFPTCPQCPMWSTCNSNQIKILKHLCTMPWERCGGSHFKNHMAYITPNYKNIFSWKQETAFTCHSIAPPLLLYNLVHILFNVSWSGRAQMRRLMDNEHSKWTSSRVFMRHTLIQCATFNHIENRFPQTINPIFPMHTFLIIILHILNCNILL